MTIVERQALRFGVGEVGYELPARRTLLTTQKKARPIEKLTLAVSLCVEYGAWHCPT